MALKLRSEHALHNENLKWRSNHICCGKEIVKTVHHQLHGNCKEENMVEISVATIETHVRGDDRSLECQRPQTDIRT